MWNSRAVFSIFSWMVPEIRFGFSMDLHIRFRIRLFSCFPFNDIIRKHLRKQNIGAWRLWLLCECESKAYGCCSTCLLDLGGRVVVCCIVGLYWFPLRYFRDRIGERRGKKGKTSNATASLIPPISSQACNLIVFLYTSVVVLTYCSKT